MKKTRWIAHKRLLHAADEIKKAERRISYIISDIDAVLSPASLRFKNLNSCMNSNEKETGKTFFLESLNKKLLSEQEKKASLSDAFFELISCVPSPSDETLHLYYLKGFSVTEIAIKRDLSEGTVKNHLSYGRDLIYEKIKGNLK